MLSESKPFLLSHQQAITVECSTKWKEEMWLSGRGRKGDDVSEFSIIALNANSNKTTKVTHRTQSGRFERGCKSDESKPISIPLLTT